MREWLVAIVAAGFMLFLGWAIFGSDVYGP